MKATPRGPSTARTWLRRISLGAAAVSAFTSHAANASEGGASVYLLGSGGPQAGVLPPIKGVFFANTLYRYDAGAKAEKQFLVGGNLVAGVDATITADFATVLWTPTTDFAGGVLSVGAALPVGEPSVDVAAVITGPGGGQVSISESDSTFVVGDPLITAAVGWQAGKVHIAASTLVNIPVGQYREAVWPTCPFTDGRSTHLWQPHGWTKTLAGIFRERPGSLSTAKIQQLTTEPGRSFILRARWRRPSRRPSR